MSIHILSPLMVSKIAAGEVVERPASVVKELVENALDAGANRISVEVEGGGTGLIRVVDNGAGIPAGEVGLAFERHATSKIVSEADIDNISSLGFRGEALPAIASVSTLTMLTRHVAAEAGTRIVLEFGLVKEKAKQGCPQGTAVTVRNLFQNVPARLKFLKSVATEGGHISQTVSQYCLAYPEVKFTLAMNGRKLLDSSGNSRLTDAAIEVYGLETGQSMLEVAGVGADAEASPLVTGLVSPPNVSRAGRNYLTFFVNRRWVQNRMLSFAVEEAYHGMLMTGRHPIVILDIRMSSADVDVNVHPAKREIKFRDERTVFLAVQRAVRATLTGAPAAPALTLSARRAAASEPVSIPLPFTDGVTADVSPAAGGVPAAAGTGLPILRVIGQYQETYIVAEGSEGLYLVDQHAAHERILYEKIREQMSSRQVEVQGLLSPMMVELTSRQAEAAEALRGPLEAGGFHLEGFGERALLLRAVPAVISEPEVIPVLLDILDAPGEDKSHHELMHRMAASLACHGSVRAGQPLSRLEMEELLQQLERTSVPRTCPHGRPTMMYISASRLESEFGRH